MVGNNVVTWRHLFASLFFIFVLIIPESPRYYAKKRNDVKAKKIMKYLASGVKDYDVDHEYAVIMNEIEEGEAIRARQKGGPWAAIFQGTNLVSFVRSTT